MPCYVMPCYAAQLYSTHMCGAGLHLSGCSLLCHAALCCVAVHEPCRRLCCIASLTAIACRFCSQAPQQQLTIVPLPLPAAAAAELDPPTHRAAGQLCGAGLHVCGELLGLQPAGRGRADGCALWCGMPILGNCSRRPHACTYLHVCAEQSFYSCPYPGEPYAKLSFVLSVVLHHRTI